MWVSKYIALRQRGGEEEMTADLGVTTIGGENASVMTRGEQRNLEVLAPGGLVWQPRAGDAVLVVKGGTGAQEQCVAAACTAGHAPAGMVPGELFLYSSGGASIYLRANGAVEISGNLTVNGQPFPPIES